MPGMMRWDCSRGCCLRDNRQADNRQWLEDWKAEQCSVDIEYELAQLLADERVTVAEFCEKWNLEREVVKEIHVSDNAA